MTTPAAHRSDDVTMAGVALVTAALHKDNLAAYAALRSVGIAKQGHLAAVAARIAADLLEQLAQQLELDPAEAWAHAAQRIALRQTGDTPT